MIQSILGKAAVLVTDLSARVKELSGLRFERLLTVDRSYLDYLFTFLLVITGGVFLAETLEYSSDARIVPLVVAVPTVAMVVLLLVTQLLSEYVDPVEDISAAVESGSDEFRMDSDGSEGVESADATTARKRVLTILLWVVALLAVLYLLGTIVGSAIFLFAYYHRRSEGGLKETTIYTVAVWVFLVVLFKLFLDTSLYPGVLGSEIVNVGALI